MTSRRPPVRQVPPGALREDPAAWRFAFLLVETARRDDSATVRRVLLVAFATMLAVLVVVAATVVLIHLFGIWPAVTATGVGAVSLGTAALRRRR
ncbi:hypothetical protein ACIOD2_41360 [Amycolatopsis sp. NPDC088138]|uniref:hypothetical protein n=1 Tax=Amycolatopsis sp. NPDC088138 TaxID=3363938 RepID=UPI0038142675